MTRDRALVVLLVVLVLVGLASGPTTAAAQPTGGRVAPCQPDDAPVLVLSFSGEDWDPRLVDEVGGFFRANAEAQGFYLCAPGTLHGVEPAATVDLRHAGHDGAVVVWIDVRDAVTRKRLSRELDLGDFPEDSRALALAVASDELLRASWIELALSDGDAGAPTAVRRVVEDDVASASLGRAWLGARFAVEGYGGGEVLLGGDVALGLRLLPRLSLELDVGLRAGRSHASTNGSVQAAALGGGATWALRLVPGEHLALDALLGARVSGVRYEGDPGPGAEGAQRAAVAVVGRVGLRLVWRPLPRLGVRLGGGMGLPFVGVDGRDEGETVAGLTGWEAFGQLGLAVAL